MYVVVVVVVVRIRVLRNGIFNSAAVLSDCSVQYFSSIDDYSVDAVIAVCRYKVRSYL
jgi:hypothetical protein